MDGSHCGCGGDAQGSQRGVSSGLRNRTLPPLYPANHVRRLFLSTPLSLSFVRLINLNTRYRSPKPSERRRRLTCAGGVGA